MLNSCAFTYRLDGIISWKRRNQIQRENQQSDKTNPWKEWERNANLIRLCLLCIVRDWYFRKSMYIPALLSFWISLAAMPCSCNTSNFWYATTCCRCICHNAIKNWCKWKQRKQERQCRVSSFTWVSYIPRLLSLRFVLVRLHRNLLDFQIAFPHTSSLLLSPWLRNKNELKNDDVKRLQVCMYGWIYEESKRM